MLQQIAQNKSRQNNVGHSEPLDPRPAPAPVTAPVLAPDRAPGPPPSLPKQTPSAPPVQVSKPYSVASSSSNAAPVQTAESLATTMMGLKDTTSYSFVPDQSIGDLSQFNFTLFDPTSSLHWIQFAQHWHNTYQVGISSRFSHSTIADA